MKFGWLCSHESYQPEALVSQATLAEQVGFDVILGSDHFHPWVDDTSAAGFVWSWLGAVADATTRAELGTSVTCPLFHYHPALVAQAAATVDRLSGGRFFLGVGTGEAINEAPLGFEFPGYRGRMERLSEALEIIDRMQAGEKLTYAGKHYQTDSAKLYSPPLRRMPILMAAGGPKSAAFAGAHADGVITSVKDPKATLENVLEPFREAARHSGRPSTPTVLATRWCVLAQNHDEAWHALASMRGLRAPGRLEAVDPAVLRERADSMDPQEILSQYARAASAEDLIEVYRPLVQDIGADYVSIQVASVDPERTIEMVGEKVLPALREMSTGE